MAIAGPATQTSIRVAHPVVKFLQMLLQVGVAIIGLVMRIIKNQEIVVLRKSLFLPMPM